MIIAIDGPAAAGKGTLGRRLAEHLGLAYLDTGALYRAVGLTLTRSGRNLDDDSAAADAACALTPSDLESLLSDPALREEATGKAASRIAAFPSVRAALLALQRDFAHAPPPPAKGAVLDGRDIGTVVCPDADVKIFVTADVEERARRRMLELHAKGIPAIESCILRDMKDRDARDCMRDVAPLRPAEDAFVLDSSTLSAEAAFVAVLDHLAAAGFVRFAQVQAEK